MDACLLKEAGDLEWLLKSRYIASGEHLRVTWIDMDGNVLFENNADAGGMNNHGDRPEIVQAFAEGKGRQCAIPPLCIRILFILRLGCKMAAYPCGKGCG